MKKITKVVISFKYSIKHTINNKVTVEFKFPTITYTGDDLKGKRNWSNTKWIDFAINDYCKYIGLENRSSLSDIDDIKVDFL